MIDLHVNIWLLINSRRSLPELHCEDKLVEEIKDCLESGLLLIALSTLLYINATSATLMPSTPR